MVLTMMILSLICGFLLTQLADLATTIFLHRSLTHEAFKLRNPTHMFFRMVCWFTTGTIPRQWVAVHRKHHAFTDTEGDPHSPILEGFWNIQIWNTWYYVREARKIDLGWLVIKMLDKVGQVYNKSELWPAN